MPDDQQIRRGLLDYADRVPVDVDGDLARVLQAANAGAGRGRRTALLVAVPLLVAAIVGGALVGTGALGARDADRPATTVTESRLTGTWTRSLVAGGEVPAEASGTWTMVLDSDGALTLVPPDAWTADNFQPNGVYVRTGDAIRTNVFASESCDGSAGTYSFSVGYTELDLAESGDECALRTAVLDGRWERAP